MKKKNCICEFASERSELLLRNFRESIARQSVISRQKAFREAVEAPAPRFWVSEARAMRIISSLLNGIDLTEGMRPEKRRMYHEIFRRVKEIKEKNPQTPLGDIVFEVVNNEAPHSYISWQSAAKLVSKFKRSRLCKRL